MAGAVLRLGCLHVDAGGGEIGSELLKEVFVVVALVDLEITVHQGAGFESAKTVLAQLPLVVEKKVKLEFGARLRDQTERGVERELLLQDDPRRDRQWFAGRDIHRVCEADGNAVEPGRAA